MWEDVAACLNFCLRFTRLNQSPVTRADFSILLWLAADYFTLPHGRRFYTLWEEPALSKE